MKKNTIFYVLVISILLILPTFAKLTADNAIKNLENEFNDIMTKAGKGFLNDKKGDMGFMSGSGIISPANASGFIGIKTGFNGGVVLPKSVLDFGQKLSDEELDNMLDDFDITSENADAFADLLKVSELLVYPSFDIYFKIGMPNALPIPEFDIGIRINAMPAFNSTLDDNGSFNMHSGGFGIEGRFVLLKVGVFQLETRGIIDGRGGKIEIEYGDEIDLVIAEAEGEEATGTYDYNSALSYSWGGVTFGVRALGGINLPIIGNLLTTGFGLDLNAGSVKFDSSLTGQATVNIDGSPTTEHIESIVNLKEGYSPVEFRYILNFNIAMFGSYFEYGFLTGAIGVGGGLHFRFL